MQLKLPTKLLPAQAYINGRPRVWLLPLNRKYFNSFSEGHFVSLRGMWTLERDIMEVKNKQEILEEINNTAAFINASNAEKENAAVSFYSWIKNVRAHDFIIGFLGIGHLAIGEVLGPCIANLDAESSIFKYARAAQWCEVKLPIGCFSNSEQLTLNNNRERLYKLDQLTSTRSLLLALSQAPQWNDHVLWAIAQRFTPEFLQEFDAERFNDYIQLLTEAQAMGEETSESAESLENQATTESEQAKSSELTE